VTDLLFIVGMAIAFGGYIAWGIRILPAERWQMAAAVPLRKEADGLWLGLNLTWYGILSANAYVAAALLFLVLMGSAGVPHLLTAALVGLLLLVCVPAASVVARLVEGKRHTFTVGGAVFVGVILAPWLIAATSRWLAPGFGVKIPGDAVLAAFAIAYSLGEGLGRLACLSFGCCYGRPMAKSHPFLQLIFARSALIFSGATKKTAYGGGLEGERLLPVQSLTAILYCGTALVGSILFLQRLFAAAYLVSLLITQLWRSLSEFLRADYRGDSTISAYQIMGVVAVIYGMATTSFFPHSHPATLSLSDGLTAVWAPAPLISLQLLWLFIFFHTGRSMVTGSTISFHVHENRV